MKSFLATALLAIAVPAAVEAAPVTIFSETFDADNGGASQLNYAGFAQFTVSDGTVDLIANGGYGITCVGATGSCVDLDGSTGNAGLLASTAIAVAAGTSYTLSFDLSGNQRVGGATDSVTYGISGGILADASIALLGSAPFQTVTVAFTAAADGVGSIFFQNAGGDNIGAILDNVRLVADMTPVPLPASLPLLLAGLAGLGLARRRRR